MDIWAFLTIGPYEFPLKVHMDQWLPKSLWKFRSTPASVHWALFSVTPRAIYSDRPGSVRFGYSQSPKAGHPKAGQSDFRNQRFKPDTGKMRKMRTSLPPQENKGPRRFRRTKTRKTQKMRKMRTRKRGKCGKCGWLALMWLALGDPQLRFGDGTVQAVPVFGSGGSSAKRVCLCFSRV